MNANAKKWVQALRSGKYKQAHGTLGKEDGSRCCLGVLCDLAVEAGVIKTFNLYSTCLPEEVTMWAGLSSDQGAYGRNLALWRDNDGGWVDGKVNSPKRFKTIARIIESEPEGLFVK